MYFNQIYFGEGAYGVEAAAKTFFNKPLARADAARVRAARRACRRTRASTRRAGARRRPARAARKVLRNMLATKAITQVEFDNADAARRSA